jgi:D-threo-aldose 1-dehydrogenase
MSTRDFLPPGTLGLGTAPLSGLFSEVSESQAQDTIAAAYRCGVRYFDTAPLYGHGLAEQRLGRGLARIDRQSVIVSTKVGRLLRRSAPADRDDNFAGALPANPIFDFSADGAVRSLHESLERLGLDAVDVALIHDPDDHYNEALKGAYPALERLRTEGVVRSIGVGMNQTHMPAQFVRETDIDCVLLAGRYTLLDQSGLTELLPLCYERGVTVIAAGVFNSGVLAEPRPDSTYDYLRVPPSVLEKAQNLDLICRRHSVPLAAAAVQFPLGHPAVRAVLVGARSAREMELDADLSRFPIPDALWHDLKDSGLLPNDVPVPAVQPNNASADQT